MKSRVASRAAALRHVAKRLAYTVLPESWQESIDKRFYERRFASGDLSPEAEFELLPALVRRADVAVDVGANLGGYTIRLSGLVGPAGLVHAFEPVPRTFRLLEHNVRRFAPYRNVRLYQSAVSDTVGTASIHLPLEGSTPNFYTASLAQVSDHDRLDHVETTTLDQVLAGRDIALLKVDTEGAEWKVLSGARKLLARSRPAIICEIGSGILRFGRSPGDLFDMLAEFDYRAFRYVEGTLIEVFKPDDRRLPNYVFLSRDEAARLTASHDVLPHERSGPPGDRPALA